MKYYLIIICLIFCCFNIKAQNVTDTSKSSISQILSERLAKVKVVDSCLLGFYFIQFKLDKSNHLTQFSSSENLPLSLKTKINSELKNILEFYPGDFFSKELKNHKGVFVIPLLVHIDNDCAIPSNKYIEKVSLDSLGTQSSSLNISNAILLEFAKDIVHLQNTFLASMINDFNHKNSKCVSILNPCLVQRKSKLGFQM